MPLLVIAALALVIAGCGGDDDGDSDGAATNVLAEAVEKTEAAKTARMDTTVTVSGGASETFRAEMLVDFENDRAQLTMGVEGQTIQMYTDGTDEYIRQGTSGRYQRLPASADSPVANNPIDSLQYVGTDVVDVSEGDESGCYEGQLDFDRVFRRVERGRESEFPDELRGQRAPVLVCLDDAGRIRRYDVELAFQGTTVDTKSTMSDYETAPPLEALGPDERPR